MLALKVPAAHVVHSRSCVDDPALLMRDPGPQLAKGTHAVASMPVL